MTRGKKDEVDQFEVGWWEGGDWPKNLVFTNCMAWGEAEARQQGAHAMMTKERVEADLAALNSHECCYADCAALMATCLALYEREERLRKAAAEFEASLSEYCDGPERDALRATLKAEEKG